MRRVFIGLAIAASTVAMVACATTQTDRYVICNDMAPNVTCPDNTANVVVRM